MGNKKDEHWEKVSKLVEEYIALGDDDFMDHFLAIQIAAAVKFNGSSQAEVTRCLRACPSTRSGEVAGALASATEHVADKAVKRVMSAADQAAKKVLVRR